MLDELSGKDTFVSKSLSNIPLNYTFGPIKDITKDP